MAGLGLLGALGGAGKAASQAAQTTVEAELEKRREQRLQEAKRNQEQRRRAYKDEVREKTWSREEELLEEKRAFELAKAQANRDSYKTVRGEDGSVVQVNEKTGEREYLVKPDAERLSETDREIRDLVARGVPEHWAKDVARGNVKIDTDQFGNVVAMNRATREVRTLRKAGAPEGEVEIGKGDVEVGSRAGGEKAEDSGVFGAVDKGTGPGSNVKSAIGSVIGPFVEGTMFPETEKARSALRNFNQSAKQGLVNSERFPVYEQKIVAELLPNPETFFQDPDAVRERLIQLRDHLRQKQAMNERSIRSGNVTTKKRGELANQNATIDRILGLMGEPGTDTGGGNAEPAGGSSAGAAGGESGGGNVDSGASPGYRVGPAPGSAPRMRAGGSRDVPISSMSLDQLQDLETGSLSSEELLEANRRYREVRNDAR